MSLQKIKNTDRFFPSSESGAQSRALLLMVAGVVAAQNDYGANNFYFLFFKCICPLHFSASEYTHSVIKLGLG